MSNSIMTNSPVELIKTVTSIIGAVAEKHPTKGMCDKLSTYIYNNPAAPDDMKSYIMLTDVRSMMRNETNKPADRRMLIADICLRVVNMANILADQGCIDFKTEVIYV
jgi:hypothetical protein